MLINKIESLNLSFSFELIKNENRIIYLKINKLKRNLKYSKKIFNWFMEDLVIFLNHNKFQRRWDYSKIIVSEIENMNFSLKDTNDFKSKFSSITSWDMEWI